MTPLWLGLVFLLTVHHNDVHLFPNHRACYWIETSLLTATRIEEGNALEARLHLSFAQAHGHEEQRRVLWESFKTWHLVNVAWAWTETSQDADDRRPQEQEARKYLFLLRCRIGWGAYERGEIPIPSVRINP